MALPMASQVICVDTFEMSFGEYTLTLALPLSREGTETWSSRASEPKVSAALEKILAPLRGLGGESEYIWEEGCLTQLKFKKKTVMRSIPISRQRWQFQDQPIFHGYRELNHVY